MRIWAFCMFMVTICACSNNKAPRILNQRDMGKVLWDVMLVEEYSNIRMTRDSIKNIDLDRLHLYQKVFQLHNVTKADFSASLKYYASKPDIMRTILDSLAVMNRQKKIPLPTQ